MFCEICWNEIEKSQDCYPLPNGLGAHSACWFPPPRENHEANDEED